jgi:acyl carrier protein
MNASNRKKLIKIFINNLRLKKKFDENLKIYSIKNWDSLSNFNILLDIEKEFKIRFNTKEFSELNNFKQILQNVKKKITHK